MFTLIQTGLMTKREQDMIQPESAMSAAEIIITETAAISISTEVS